MNNINNIKKKIYAQFIKEKVVYIPEGDELKDKVVLITGATGGVGHAVTEVLYKKGATIAMMCRHPDKQKELFGSYDQKRTLLLTGDVNKPNDCKNAVEKTVNKFHKIDAVINCAGVMIFKALEEINEEEWEKLFNTNVKGIFHMSKAVIPYMKKQKDGLIVNVGSKISHNTNVTEKKVLYTTSKYAVEGFSLSLNNELRKYGIKVSCIMPGTINTFPSLQSHTYLPAHRIGQIIAYMIMLDDVHFEGIIFKSKYQNL